MTSLFEKPDVRQLLEQTDSPTVGDALTEPNDVAAGDSELALVRHLDIRRTPTTVILDGQGEVLARASGVPRREQVMAVVGPPETPQVSDR